MKTVGSQGPLVKPGSHIDASHARQPLVKGERLVRYEVEAVMIIKDTSEPLQKWRRILPVLVIDVRLRLRMHTLRTRAPTRHVSPVPDQVGPAQPPGASWSPGAWATSLVLR